MGHIAQIVYVLVALAFLAIAMFFARAGKGVRIAFFEWALRCLGTAFVLAAAGCVYQAFGSFIPCACVAIVGMFLVLR